ncbi:DUF3846 domain-containing protein [Streptomyces sp. NBC_01237]|uniref:DUF3846 domain-containing protein n=1 Tax=Streptomyces sp. NBC_01237 TaxID=2903790 RepID=UPI002DD86B0E|nr:DUF3846 domain-containing protein [Streptomyces sp. NBC_01237]WRZ78760.1 DUF3846 domain-containing protein [Streptomyces sp. NBC_01237]
MTDTQQSIPLALRLEADGRFMLIEWPAAGTLQVLYTAIGCQTITAVDISPQLTMWLDDTGVYSGAPVNSGATALYAAHRPQHQNYYGTAVITGGTDGHGNSLPLTTDQITAIVEFHCTVGDAKIPSQRDNRGI